MAEAKHIPPSAPAAPPVADRVEWRRQQYRAQIDALTAAIVEHKAAGRFASAAADAKLVARLRRKLASLSPGDLSDLGDLSDASASELGTCPVE